MLACRSDFVLTLKKHLTLIQALPFVLKMSSVFKLTSVVFGQASTFQTRFFS